MRYSIVFPVFAAAAYAQTADVGSVTSDLGSSTVRPELRLASLTTIATIVLSQLRSTCENIG